MFFRFVTLFFLALTSPALGAETHPAVGSVISSVLATVHEGDREKTQESIARLERQYIRYLKSFRHQPECFEGDRIIHSACEIFEESELQAVNAGTWTESYDFEKAAFSNTTGVYNFFKSLPLTELDGCKIKLQLSVDLPNKYILSNEYWTDCSK